jgi:hypothetical protein
MVFERRCLAAGLSLAAIVLVTAARGQSPGFAASPPSGPGPLAVTFSYPHTAENSTWILDIDFGNGGSASMGSPCGNTPTARNCAPGGAWTATHSYSEPGTYVATLTRGGLPLCFTCRPPVLGSVTVTVNRT